MAIKIEDSFIRSAERVARSIRKQDDEYLIVDHQLEAGEVVPEGIHASNEWIILQPKVGPDDQCEITVGGETEIVKLGATVKCVFVPAGERHSLRAITAVSYTIQRDGFS